MTDPTNSMPPDLPAHPADVPPHATPAPAGTTVPPPTAQPQDAPLAGPPSPAVPATRSNGRALVVGGVALVIALGIGGAVIATSSDDAKPAAGAKTSASPSTVAQSTAAPISAAPTSAAPTSAAPTRAVPQPKPKPPSYKALSAREWKLIAKNPDAYIGKTYVVFGQVTQFDAATGTDTFRANVAHRRMAEDFEYETNTMLSGSESDLRNLVEDDIFRANVTVLGSFSYSTQIGGETTVPLLRVDSIKVL